MDIKQSAYSSWKIRVARISTEDLCVVVLLQLFAANPTSLGSHSIDPASGFLALTKWTSVYLLCKFASVIFTPFSDFTEHFTVIIRNRDHVWNN